MRAITIIKKILLEPRKVVFAISFRLKSIFFWNFYYKRLREPKRRGRAKYGGTNTQERVIQSLRDFKFSIQPLRIDPAKYNSFIDKCRYFRFPGYYGGGRDSNFSEKSLQHYLAWELLDIREGEIYIDIANAGSPTPEIYSELSGCRSYRQDLDFEAGIHGNRIGGDGAKMPIENSFVNKMALHCSFEHFEGDADSRFIEEANRVLKIGGKLCILPLYLSTDFSIQTHPVLLPLGGIDFDKDAELCCTKDWANRHGRFYDVCHFDLRVRKFLKDLKLTIFLVENAKEIDKSCYVKYIALFEKC